MNVWLYWEGPEPPIIEFCIRTAQYVYPDAKLLDRTAITHMRNGSSILRQMEQAPKVQQRSDLLRLWLLARHPDSLWLDCDFLHLRRIPFEKLGVGKDLVTIGNSNPQHWPNAPLLSRTGEVAAEAFERACRVTGKSYLAYGSDILYEMSTGTWGDRMHKEPRRPWLSGIEFKQKPVVLEASDLDLDCYAFHFSSSLIGKIRQRDIDSLADAATPLGRMILQAKAVLHQP